jgi:hypothetical protein
VAYLSRRVGPPTGSLEDISMGVWLQKARLAPVDWQPHVQVKVQVQSKKKDAVEFIGDQVYKGITAVAANINTDEVRRFHQQLCEGTPESCQDQFKDPEPPLDDDYMIDTEDL